MKLLSPVPEGYEVYSSSASLRPDVVDVVGDVRGLRIGLLGNLKPNADVLLKVTGELLTQAGAASTFFVEKENCSLGAPEGILDQIAATCDAAVVALGDCGSCTSWAIHDAVELHRRGMPTVTYVADPFLPLATHEIHGLGVPDLELALLPYPMSGVAADEIARRAKSVSDQVVSALSRGPVDAGRGN
jgi:hypothetical protein